MIEVPYFELHITMEEKKDRECFVRSIVDHLEWKFSKIDGDPVLGNGIKMYATKHLKTDKNHCAQTIDAAYGILKDHGINVVRAKVECVIYDKVFENVQGS